MRDVLPDAEQWRIGGGPAAGVAHTRIMDVGWPEAGVQESLLAEFAEADSVAGLGPDEFGGVPVFVAG